MTTDIETTNIETESETVAEVKAETDTANPLFLLQQAIASMPAADAERVQAAINKLRNEGLDILGTAEERLESAMRIAKHIIDEASGTGQ